MLGTLEHRCQSDRLQKNLMLATLLSTVVRSLEEENGLFEDEAVEPRPGDPTLLRHVLQEVVKRSAITLPPVTGAGWSDVPETSESSGRIQTK